MSLNHEFKIEVGYLSATNEDERETQLKNKNYALVALQKLGMELSVMFILYKLDPNTKTFTAQRCTISEEKVSGLTKDFEYLGKTFIAVLTAKFSNEELVVHDISNLDDLKSKDSIKFFLSGHKLINIEDLYGARILI